MTKSDFADLILGRRFSSSMRNALEMILVHGRGQTEAAEKNGLHRQAVNRAVSSFKSRCTFLDTHG